MVFLSSSWVFSSLSLFFFFNDTATTEIYTLSLHDALPIFASPLPRAAIGDEPSTRASSRLSASSSCWVLDRKSTRLNSSHLVISYAVFCLKKKNHNTTLILRPHSPARHGGVSY